MNIPFTLIFIAVIATSLGISILRPFAISINLVDKPNNRKKHKGFVPLIGGLAMFFGFLITILSSSIDLNDFKYFILASFIVVIVGALDDHRDMSVGFRILFQLIAALIIAAVADINIVSLGDLLSREVIYLGSWSIFFTIISIITAMNAVNMADGIHGLAGLNSLITFGSIAYLSFIALNEMGFVISILMCAVLLSFLVDNLCIFRSKSKRIFMGDAGSMFLGLVIALLLINLSQGETKVFNPVIALWLFAVPLIDIFSTVTRRVIRGKSPFKPDRNHFHHILIQNGFGNISVLFIMSSMSFLMAMIGIYGVITEIPEWKMFFGFMVLFVAYYFVSLLLISKIKQI